MVFGIDFDNTISTHNYPFVGELVPMAKEVINTLNDNGHYIFLWTVRGDESWDSEGKINALQNAREFLDENEIEIDGFNSSPIHPSSSPKQHCDYFIDDINLSTPYIMYHGHRVVDWVMIAIYLKNAGAINTQQLDKLIETAETDYPEIWGVDND